MPTSMPKIAEPAVAVKDLHKAFGENKVLDGVTLEVPRGSTLAVLGRSGTGKSVLLKLIVGLAQPDSGTIRILGEEVNGISIDQMSEVRKKIGFLFQHAALYDSLTVAQNVAFPLEHHRREMSRTERDDRVDHLLDEVGMKNSHRKMPSDISGGMRKRVGLARALALGPQIILLDEPTAGLDPISSREIDELVLSLGREHQMTSIVVTHDIFSAKTISDSLALLDKGHLVIQGTYKDLEDSNIEFVQEFLKHA
jgi:phospholipid/cholesterol/gamma-HCH transport system ATP-binding protein